MSAPLKGDSTTTRCVRKVRAGVCVPAGLLGHRRTRPRKPAIEQKHVLFGDGPRALSQRFVRYDVDGRQRTVSDLGG